MDIGSDGQIEDRKVASGAAAGLQLDSSGMHFAIDTGDFALVIDSHCAVEDALVRFEYVDREDQRGGQLARELAGRDDGFTIERLSRVVQRDLAREALGVEALRRQSELRTPRCRKLELLPQEGQPGGP
jgi:hypothetical protein